MMLYNLRCFLCIWKLICETPKTSRICLMTDKQTHPPTDNSNEYKFNSMKAWNSAQIHSIIFWLIIHQSTADTHR